MIQKNSFLFIVPRKSWIHYGLVLSLIILVLGTNFAIGQTKSIKLKGRNIIRDKQSGCYLVMPGLEDELASMNERVNQEGITDEEIKAIEARGTEISKELKRLYKERHNEEELKKIKIKRDLLTSIIIDETIDSNAASRLRDIPIIGIGTDYEYDAIEIIIKADMFTEGNIEKYIKAIRKIVGDEIDISLSPGEIPQLGLCPTRITTCDPVQAGVVVNTPWAPCTIGFRATFNGDDGFVTAGHCVDNIVGLKVFQGDEEVGIIAAETNTTIINGCDCGFVKMSNDREMSENIFFVGTPTVVGRSNSIDDFVKMSGGFSNIKFGFVQDFPNFRLFLSSITGLVTIVLSPIETNIDMAGGDSGAPVVTANINDPLEIRGTMIGSSQFNRSWYTSITSFESHFPGINWGI